MSFLELNNVIKSYGSNTVLRGINLHVEKHEVVCLIGASGCGKSDTAAHRQRPGVDQRR